MRRFKVLRVGVGQVREDGTSFDCKVGSIITMSEQAAEHLLSESPPWVEEVFDQKDEKGKKA